MYWYVIAVLRIVLFHFNLAATSDFNSTLGPLGPGIILSFNVFCLLRSLNILQAAANSMNTPSSSPGTRCVICLYVVSQCFSSFTGGGL